MENRYLLADVLELGGVLVHLELLVYFYGEQLLLSANLHILALFFLFSLQYFLLLLFLLFLLLFCLFLFLLLLISYLNCCQLTVAINVGARIHLRMAVINDQLALSLIAGNIAMAHAVGLCKRFIMSLMDGIFILCRKLILFCYLYILTNITAIIASATAAFSLFFARKMHHAIGALAQLLDDFVLGQVVAQVL